MEIGSVFLVLAVMVIVGLYLYIPFTKRIKQVDVDENHEVSALKAERDRVINSLQELDFDFRLGKIPAEDYPTQRANLLQKGADVLRQLDKLEHSETTQDEKARIEQAASESKLNNDIEALIAMRRQERRSKSAGFCPNCGKPVLVTDQFCPSCGHNLK